MNILIVISNHHTVQRYHETNTHLTVFPVSGHCQGIEIKKLRLTPLSRSTPLPKTEDQMRKMITIRWIYDVHQGRDRTSYLRYRTVKLALSRSCSLRWSYIFLVATDDGRLTPAAPRWYASDPTPARRRGRSRPETPARPVAVRGGWPSGGAGCPGSGKSILHRWVQQGEFQYSTRNVGLSSGRCWRWS